MSFGADAVTDAGTSNEGVLSGAVARTGLQGKKSGAIWTLSRSNTRSKSYRETKRRHPRFGSPERDQAHWDAEIESDFPCDPSVTLRLLLRNTHSGRLFSSFLHQFLGRLDILDIDDVVPPFHRIGPMAGNPHPHDLWDSSPTHVPNRSPPQVMELQLRYAGGCAGLPPRKPKLLVGSSVTVEDCVTAASFFAPIRAKSACPHRGSEPPGYGRS